MEENDINIVEDEGRFGGKEENYSHQALVMKAKRRVLELGQHELAEGINEKELDEKNGITKLVYKEDTKKAFINSIKILRMLMECDYDKKAWENIGEILKSVEEEEKELLKKQNKEWTSLNLREKKLFPNFNPNFLDIRFGYYQSFLEFEIDANMGIFSELNSLAKRKNWYSAEVYENYANKSQK